MNSDDMLEAVVDTVTAAVGCHPSEARCLIFSISAYISRFTEEIHNQYGPAWACWQEMERTAVAD